MKAIFAMVQHLFSYDRKRVLWVIIFCIFASLLEGVSIAMLVPVLGFVLDVGQPDKVGYFLGWDLNYQTLVIGALFVFVLASLISALMVWRRSILVSEFRMRFVGHLSKSVQSGMLSMRPQYTAAKDRVAMTHLMTMDVEVVGQVVNFLSNVISQLTRLPALAAVVIVLSPGAAAAIFVVLVVLVLLGRPFDQQARFDGRELIRKGARHLGQSDESLASETLIKTHGAEARWIKRHETAVDERYQLQHALARGQASARAMATGGGTIGMALIIGVTLLYFEMPLTETVVIILALSRLLPAVVQFHAAYRSAIAAVPSHQRCTAFLEEAAKHKEPPLPPRPTDPDLSLSLDRVGIARLPDGAEIVKELSLDINTGEAIAIMGRSGAGKTTLALGVAGFLPFSSGSVKLNGKELVGDDQLLLRSAAVLMPQDPVLLNTTVAENLKLVKEMATNEELWSALEQAQASDLVRALPNGLDTVIGDRAARLSGGERQRIALAQAFLSDSKFLILDEATSALDAETEDAVLDNLWKRRAETAILFVTHRPGIARRADYVAVMENGAIVQTGSWSDIATAESYWSRV